MVIAWLSLPPLELTNGNKTVGANRLPALKRHKYVSEIGGHDGSPPWRCGAALGPRNPPEGRWSPSPAGAPRADGLKRMGATASRGECR